MLKELGIQIFIETIFINNRRWLPIHFIGKFKVGVHFEFNFRLRRQIHIDDMLSVISDIKFFMGPYVIFVISFVDLPNDA